MDTGVPPAGWYPDPATGELHWWDGTTWGPAPPAPQSTSGRTLALVSHLGIFAGGFVLPLVIYLTAGKKEPFVRHHSCESLNFQITFMAFWFGGFIVLVLATGLISGAEWLFFVGVLVMMVGMFIAMGLAVYGMVQASRGVLWRYPVNIRLVGRS